jgi:hypothetical protein
MSTKGITIIDPTKNGGNVGFKTSFFAGIHKQLGLMSGFQGLSQDMNKYVLTDVAVFLANKPFSF